MKKALIFVILSGLIIGLSGLAKEEAVKEKAVVEEVAPIARFIYPSSDQRIEGTIEIKLEVKNAASVEFYLQRPESLMTIYLGQGISKPDNIWYYQWDSAKTPNGTYRLFARIENQYGEYESEEITVIVENLAEDETEKKQEIEKEVEQAEKEIEQEEKKAEQEKAATKEEIVKEYENLIEETEAIVRLEAVVLPPAAPGGFMPSEQFSEEIGKKIEEFDKEIKKEVEQGNKKEKEAEKGLQEQKIKELEQEVVTVESHLQAEQQLEFRNVLQIIKEDKEKKLGEEKEEKERIEKELEKIEKELADIAVKKEEIKKAIKARGSKILEPVTQITKEKPEVQKKIEEKLVLAQEKVEQKMEKLEKEISQKEVSKIEKFSALLKDSDNDGLSNKEELVIETNPLNPDSDGDGYLDGVEIETGFNPLDPSPAQRIIYEEPRKSKVPISKVYKVERVDMVSLPTQETGLKIEGKGIPNSFVTIYVYSLPLVLITKTDENGNFVYILDKPLSDGYHQVYVAITDNKGKVVERSEAFNFLKTPIAVAAVVSSALPAEAISPAVSLGRTYALLVTSVIVLASATALFIIDILIRRKKVA